MLLVNLPSRGGGGGGGEGNMGWWSLRTSRMPCVNQCVRCCHTALTYVVCVCVFTHADDDKL